MSTVLTILIAWLVASVLLAAAWAAFARFVRRDRHPPEPHPTATRAARTSAKHYPRSGLPRLPRQRGDTP